MLQMKTSVLCVAVAALAISGVSQAGTITEILTGTIGPGSNADDAGLFGGGILTGDAITLTFSYNPSDFLSYANGLSLPNGNEFEGYFNADVAGAVSLSVTVNFKTYTVTSAAGLPGTENTTVYNFASPGSGFVIVANDGYSSIDINLNSTAPFTLSNLATQGEMDALVEEFIVHPNTQTPGLVEIGANGQGTDFLVFSLQQSNTTTPEPASWGMLVAGLAVMAGYRTRRRLI